MPPPNYNLGLLPGGQVFCLTQIPQGVNNTALLLVPGDFAFEPLAINCNFQTDANAANRNLVVSGIFNNVIWFMVQTGNNMTASLSWRWCIFPGCGFLTFINQVGMAAMPRVILPPGTQITFSATNAQAGDRWDNIVIPGIAWPLK